MTIKKQNVSTNYWFKIVCQLLERANIKINGNQPYDIQVKNNNFFKRILQQGSIGLGESYMDVWWECERLDIFFYRLLRARLDQKIPAKFTDIIRIMAAKLYNLQSKKRAYIVGKEHYDLGNDLFTNILDPNMQYSCGYWKDANTLNQAQQKKLELICEKLQLKPGMRLLDIGCGWGGLANFASKKYNVSVTGITISREQQRFFQEHNKGLDVKILLEDYRNLYNNQFDRIVSVGMFEHVGVKNYSTYFDIIKRNLKQEGLFLLQTIGSNSHGFNVDPWMDKYIFPNGSLPSMIDIGKSSKDKFILEDWHNFGADYDKTLMAWYRNFLTTWPKLKTNYSPRFKRMFSYYLNSCAGAFRARRIQLWQVLWSHEGIEGGLNVPR